MPLSYTDLAVDLDEANAYIAARGYPGWTGDDATKLAALRRGQDYIAGQYNDRWCEDFDNDDAPDAVMFAIIEAARRELTSPGYWSPDYVAAQAIKRISKQVGTLKKDIEYFGSGTSNDVDPVTKIIDRYLSAYVCSCSIGVLVV